MEMVSIYKSASDSDKHMLVGPHAETVIIFHISYDDEISKKKRKNEIISHMKNLAIKFKSIEDWSVFIFRAKWWSSSALQPFKDENEKRKRAGVGIWQAGIRIYMFHIWIVPF